MGFLIENEELFKSSTAVLKRLGAREQHVNHLKTVDDCMFEIMVVMLNSRVVSPGTLLFVL